MLSNNNEMSLLLFGFTTTNKSSEDSEHSSCIEALTLQCPGSKIIVKKEISLLETDNKKGTQIPFTPEGWSSGTRTCLLLYALPSL
jgi:hypothetical protein